MIVRALLAALLFGMTSCASTTAVAPKCAFSDFEPAPYDHIVESLPAATLRELSGRMNVRERDVEGGVWPAGLDAKMEIHGPNHFKEFVQTADDGTFVRKGLKPGMYCYKVSAGGFRSMLGTFVIDRSAARSAPLEIELILAE